MLRTSNIVFGLLTLVSLALLVYGIRRAKREKRSRVSMVITVIAIVGLAVGGYYIAVTQGYVACKPKVGACPANIGGNGYPCANENAVCEQGSGGNEDLRCKTVAGQYFWESACECKCRQ